jgi:hypothetical protein
MKINVTDVQFEHFTPDPSRGAARTSKRFKAGPKLKIWTDEKTIFIESQSDTIAIPYDRAIWIRRDGPAQSAANPGGSRRTRKKKVEPGLSEAPLSGTEGTAGRSKPDEGSGLLEASGQILRA